jgi:hypothetical protein
MDRRHPRTTVDRPAKIYLAGDVWVYCCVCSHERDVDRASLTLSWNTPVPLIGTHMKCSACGSRKINTKPELYPGSVEGMRRGRL